MDFFFKEQEGFPPTDYILKKDRTQMVKINTNPRDRAERKGRTKENWKEREANNREGNIAQKLKSSKWLKPYLHEVDLWLFHPVREQLELVDKLVFALKNRRVIVIKHPCISYWPDAPCHEYDNIHSKRELKSPLDVGDNLQDIPCRAERYSNWIPASFGEPTSEE